MCYHTLNLLLEDYPFRPCCSKDFTTIYSFFTLFILMIISLLSSGRGSHRLHFLGLESKDNLASMFIIGAMEGSLATVLAVEVIFWHFPLLKELPLWFWGELGGCISKPINLILTLGGWVVVFLAWLQSGLSIIILL